MKLNLGCGCDYRQGYVNVDICDVDVDVIHDLSNYPWPWESNSVDEILMQGVLEHLSDTLETMEQVWRVLKPGGLFHGSLPYCGSHFAFRDPTHVRFFDEKVFDYWTHPVPWANRKAQFKIKRIHLATYNDKLTHKLRNLIPARRLLRYFLWNMYDLIEFELTAEKYV